MIILGIDPGSSRIGYGAIIKDGNKLNHLESGLLELPAGSHQNRLAVLFKIIEELLERVRPDRVGVEKLFFLKNKKTAMSVAEARGVILSAVLKKAIPLKEVSPAEVKIAVTGSGRAGKEAVIKMVNRFLDLDLPPGADDVGDALAVAIAVCQNGIDT